MKIVVLDGHTLNPGDLSWEAIETQGDFTVYDRTSPQDVIPRMEDAEIVLVNKTILTKEILAQSPKLRYIGVLATGYNVVDLEEAAKRGIPVTNIPAYSTAAVAQMVFALLLELSNHVAHHNQRVHDGAWTESPNFSFWDFPLVELAGKTMGLIGFGRIGQETAKIAHAFGMRVIYHNPSARRSDIARSVTLDELLEQSDVISLHCPLTERNTGFINTVTIEKMKNTAILINTARGPLVNEQDLADALAGGRIAAAALDVVSVEPIEPNNPLLSAPNCLITPHNAWASREARQRLMKTAADNLENFLRGKPCNRVN